MTRFETRLAGVACAICVGLAGCGQKRDLGSQISMGVQGDGIILNTAYSSCVDQQTGGSTRSIGAAALIFGNFSLTWTGRGKTLFVGVLKVTVTGANVQGGTKEFTIAGEELEALLGVEGQSIALASSGTSVTVNSNSSSRATAYPSCALAIGPIPLVSTSATFTANVTIEMVGSAVDSSGNVERVEEKITAKGLY